MARALSDDLEKFFKHKPKTDREPTEKEILSDVKALLHGRKDGEIVVKGLAKHNVPAELTVVDNTSKPEAESVKSVFNR